MQPHEFNAFVAAIVSARTAHLLDHKRASEIVEYQANKFLPSITQAEPDFRDALLNAGQRG